MLRVAVLCVLVHAAFSDPLQWPQTYQTSGQIILPYGDIAEPFTAIVDLSKGLSYLNTYDSRFNKNSSGALRIMSFTSI